MKQHIDIRGEAVVAVEEVFTSQPLEFGFGEFVSASLEGIDRDADRAAIRL